MGSLVEFYWPANRNRVYSLDDFFESTAPRVNPTIRSLKSNLEEILMKALESLKKTVARGIVITFFAACACAAARADDVVQTVTLTPSGSDNNVTNSDVLTVFSDAVDFNKFNSALGTLDSATLSWTGSGSLTVSGNMEGQAIMSFQSSSDTETWNIFGGSTTVDFGISNAGESLALTGLTGSGTVDEGSFAETFQEQEGYFIPTVTYATGPTTGTFVLTYDYTPPSDAPPPPPPTVPELPSFAYLFTALLLVTPGLRRLAKKNA
jgi:hypothetical protein